MENRWGAWLRWSFVAGAIVDGVAAIILVRPALLHSFFGLDIEPLGAGLVLSLGYAAALMAGWTALLTWASFDPIPRAFVGPLTACPVILGLVAAEGAALLHGEVSAAKVAPMMALQIAGCIGWLALYAAARRDSLGSRPARSEPHPR